MNNLEQAHRLRRAIREARVNLEHHCRPDLTEGELIFRLDTVQGMLLIASQEMTALIDSWQSVELLKETLPASDDAY